MAPRSSSVPSQPQQGGCTPPVSPQNTLPQVTMYPGQQLTYTQGYKVLPPQPLMYQEAPIVTTVVTAVPPSEPVAVQTTCTMNPYGQAIMAQPIYAVPPSHQQLTNGSLLSPTLMHPQQMVPLQQPLPQPIQQGLSPLYQNGDPTVQFQAVPVYSAAPQSYQVPPPPPVQATMSPTLVSAPPPAHHRDDSSFQCSTKMEVVWNGRFTDLFRQFPHQWTLLPTISSPEQNPDDKYPWHEFADSAKVRFSCQKCGKAWTSMKGQVMFWYRIGEDNKGYVGFKLYGQTCGNCRSGEEHAMWYPEETVKVIQNVFMKVGETYYGLSGKVQYSYDRRSGRPRSQHNKELCQACREGTCRK